MWCLLTLIELTSLVSKKRGVHRRNLRYERLAYQRALLLLSPTAYDHRGVALFALFAKKIDTNPIRLDRNSRECEVARGDGPLSEPIL